MEVDRGVLVREVVEDSDPVVVAFCECEEGARGGALVSALAWGRGSSRSPNSSTPACLKRGGEGVPLAAKLM